MAEIKAIESNPFLGFIAEKLAGARDFANKAEIPAGIQYGLPGLIYSQLKGKENYKPEIGNAVFGQAPEMIQDMADGFKPYTGSGQTARLDDRLVDVASLPMPSGAELAKLGALGLGGMIKAFHFSPAKFDKFSDEFIGKGEGAQAFGYGHYSGENAEALDRQYRDRLINRRNNYMINDFRRQIMENPEGSRLYNELLDFYLSHGDSTMATELARSDMNSLLKTAVRNPNNIGTFDHPIHNELKNLVKGNLPAETYRKGYGYELNINRDMDELLDWNAPLDQNHSPEFRSRLPFYDEVKELADIEGKPLTGGRYYNTAAYNDELYGGIENGLEEFRDALKSEGIPGIVFAGQGGQGMPNYVMFDPNDMQVTARHHGGMMNPLMQRSWEQFQRGIK